MMYRPFAPCIAFAALAVLVVTGGARTRADAAPAKTAPIAGASSETRVSVPVRFVAQLARIDYIGSSDTTGTTMAIANPTLTTLDGNTATLAVTGGELSYSVSLSPTVERSGGKVQVLYTIRISGKSLPGATAVTTTGAARVVAGKDAVVAEMSVSDPATGRRSAFRLHCVVTTGDAASPTPASP